MKKYYLKSLTLTWNTNIREENVKVESKFHSLISILIIYTHLKDY